MPESNDSDIEGSGLGGFAPCQLTRASGEHCYGGVWDRAARAPAENGFWYILSLN